ncbi:hypothetical protein [Massilibacteroides sp.]|uniref:hypothetical protein n=1 Tax=Massilibacteroides sp. TaxID=2034766 RepID=UPI00262F2BC0|nr:hypothetical protein [Massilibacteroides sp.]MDD4515638.1 hypothetical protein [Massilibacteroides sp.]
MDVFKIKYIPDIFGSFLFEDDLVLLQEVTELPAKWESQATSQRFGITYDNVRSTRLIQSIKRRYYSVKVIMARNIDVQILSLAYTTITTTAGENFVARDISVSYEKIEGTLNVVYTIQFYRYDDTEIVNHLSSDNVLAYNTETSTEVNTLSFQVVNPAFAYSNVTTYDYNDSGTHWVAFKVALDGINANVAISDAFYVHTDNSTFDALYTHNYPNKLICYNKDSDYVYFYFDFDKSPPFIYTLNNVLIDFEPDWRGTRTGITDLTWTFNIYTFINPIISQQLTPVEGIQLEDGLVENQKINTKNKAYFKIWLTLSELWKIEFLQYAKANVVTFTLSDGTTVYTPMQMGGISSPVENTNLIDLYEFDINLMYSNKTVNVFR